MSRAGKYFKNIKKDYQYKNLRNPFFHKPKKKPKKTFFVCLTMLIIIIIFSLFWFIFFAPFWRIKDIKIEGLTRLANSEITSKIWEQSIKSRYGIFKQNNIWLFDKQEAQENILAAYNLASLKININLPRTLVVKIGERPYSFIFQQGNNYFYTSNDGYILREALVSEEDKTKYLILENKNANDLINEKNKINISDTYLNFILGLANSISIKPELSVERFIIDQEFNTIKVKFRDGPLVYFSIKLDAGTQVERLVLVKKEKIKDNFSTTKNIDLRYDDRIFIN